MMSIFNLETRSVLGCSIIKHLSRLCLILHMLISTTAATCDENHISLCKSAALNNSMDTIPGGGHCMTKHYDKFTHLCTIENPDYFPIFDHCCCHYKELLLCCRYRQGFDHFRCKEDSDKVPLSDAQVNELLKIHNWGLFVVFSLILSAICLFITISLAIGCCYQHKQMKGFWPCCGRSSIKPRKKCSKKNVHPRQVQESSPMLVVGGTDGPSCGASQDPRKNGDPRKDGDLEKSIELTELEPSAPTEAEIFTSSRDVVVSVDSSVVATVVPRNHVVDANSAGVCSNLDTICPNCTTKMLSPPSYDESLLHQVVPS